MYIQYIYTYISYHFISYHVDIFMDPPNVTCIARESERDGEIIQDVF